MEHHTDITQRNIVIVDQDRVQWNGINKVRITGSQHNHLGCCNIRPPDIRPTGHKTSVTRPIRHKTYLPYDLTTIRPPLTQDLPYVRPTLVFSHHVSVLWACWVLALPRLGDLQ